MTTKEPAGLFAERAAASLEDGTFVRLVLSAPAAACDMPERILGRAVMLRGELHLSLTYQHATRDVVRNLPVSDAARWLREQLGAVYSRAFLSTTVADWQLVCEPNRRARLIKHPPRCRVSPSREHDLPRRGILDARARDWLQGLGVLNSDARVRASMADKHRQIGRYLEILSHLAGECGWGAADATSGVPSCRLGEGTLHESANAADGSAHGSETVASSCLTVADMGCGKGYLTFGAWHLFRRVWGRAVRVIGIEARPELVAAANRLAGQIGAEGLEFVSGDIALVDLPELDALIALHACDTATDDAIRRGIALGARLIVVAPCCHKQVRPQLGRPQPLARLLEHGILEERFAEWVTDGLRALFLEWAGYRTKLLEFVGTEHTPKNLMLAAVRVRRPFSNPAARQRIRDLKAWCGLQHHALDDLLERDARPTGECSGLTCANRAGQRNAPPAR